MTRFHLRTNQLEVYTNRKICSNQDKANAAGFLFIYLFIGQYKFADLPLAHVQGVKNSFFTLKSVQKECHNTNKTNVLAITGAPSLQQKNCKKPLRQQQTVFTVFIIMFNTIKSMTMTIKSHYFCNLFRINMYVFLNWTCASPS